MKTRQLRAWMQAISASLLLASLLCGYSAVKRYNDSYHEYDYAPKLWTAEIWMTASAALLICSAVVFVGSVVMLTKADR